MVSTLSLGIAGLIYPWMGCKRGPDKTGITLWHIWPETEGLPIMNVRQRFAAMYPEVPVQGATIATNNLKAKLIGAARSQSLPDVFLLNSAWTRELGGAEHLVDLAPLAEADVLDPSRLLRPHDYQRCRQDGSMLCLPATSSSGTSMLFTNNEILARIGAPIGLRFNTWADFTRASRELVRKANPQGEMEYIALDPFMGPGMVIHSSLAFGIDDPTVSPDGRRSLLATPGSLRVAHALDDYVQTVYGAFGGYRALLEWRFRFAGQHRQPAFYSLPYDRQIFAIAAAGSLAAYKRIMSPLQVSVQPVPGLERLHGGAASHAWAYGINRHSPRRQAAWTLLRFLTLEEDGVGRFCRSFCRPSPLAGTRDRDYYEQVGPAWDGVKEAMALDIAYSASAEDEFLRYHLYSVPMRRMRGETIDTIFSDLNALYQAHLEGG